MCCAKPLLWRCTLPLPGLHLFRCWKRTFEQPAATYRWSSGQNSRTYCENRRSSPHTSPLPGLHSPPVYDGRLDIWKRRRRQRGSPHRDCAWRPKICCGRQSRQNRAAPLPESHLLSSCWRTFDMRRLRPLLRRRCSVAQLAASCAWFLRESSFNFDILRTPQGLSKRCLPSLPKMRGHGSNTARSCGIPTTGPTAPSSAPEIFRETIALCWQGLLNSFYTISIMRKLRSITNDFSIFIRACGTILWFADITQPA